MNILQEGVNKLALLGGKLDRLNRTYYTWSHMRICNFNVPDTFEEYVKQGQLSNIMYTERHEDYDSQNRRFDREVEYKEEFEEMEEILDIIEEEKLTGSMKYK